MAKRYSDYERGQYGRSYSEEEDRVYEPRARSYRDRGREDRGVIERTSDEVRSWFGDEEAERRRRMDESAGERSHREDRYRRGPRRLSDLRPGDLQASDLMTRDVMTVHHSDPVSRAAQLMRECDCGAIPVIDNDGRLIGMVTDRDITVRLVARGVDIRRAFVDDCMTDKTFACNANDSLEDCMRMMSRHQIRRLPIVDDRDRVIGILSQGDLARHAGEHPGWGERRAMADVICSVSEPTRAPYR